MGYISAVVVAAIRGLLNQSCDKMHIASNIYSIKHTEHQIHIASNTYNIKHTEHQIHIASNTQSIKHI